MRGVRSDGAHADEQVLPHVQELDAGARQRGHHVGQQRGRTQGGTSELGEPDQSGRAEDDHQERQNAVS